jgi:FAD/FMN-containing dehydrogenase
VQAAVRWCARHGVPIVAQGGNTGLSGGSVPDGSGRALLLSLRRLDRVRGLDPGSQTLTVDAGVTLQRAQQVAGEAGLLLPLSLAAEGSCTIGGNLATNAGGTQVLRFGNARDLCLGLEVITPDGELWDGLRSLRKDNTGYDLRDLYIGSEGTLGIITGAVLKLSPQPRARLAALVAVPTPAAALSLLGLAQSQLGSMLTAFELISDTCLSLVLRHVPGTRAPLEPRPPWMLLLELSSSSDEQAAQSALEGLLGEALERGYCSDAVVSGSGAQFEAFWSLREHISDAQASEGATIKHDISMPVSAVPEFIDTMGAGLARDYPTLQQVVFGHLGDGNLHYNLSPPADGSLDRAAFLSLEPALNRRVHDAVAARRGSISAEHGLGVLRAAEAARYKSPVELELMRAVKHALDPHGLLNPGKMFTGPADAMSQAP